MQKKQEINDKMKKNVKIVGSIVLSLMLVFMAISMAAASSEMVESRSETVTHAEGEDELIAVTSTLTTTTVGDNIDEVQANTQATTFASGASYLAFESTSSTTVYTADTVKKTEIKASTSTSLPKSFNAQQGINNLFDTHQNPGIEADMENIVYVGNEKYVFSSMAAFPLDGVQKNFAPSITFDPRSWGLSGLGITFGTSISNSIGAQGLDFTGSMDFETELSVGEN
nr:hypothetical protein [uncultured archaeon]